jgi:hypothetical protein
MHANPGCHTRYIKAGSEPANPVTPRNELAVCCPKSVVRERNRSEEHSQLLLTIDGDRLARSDLDRPEWLVVFRAVVIGALATCVYADSSVGE